MLTSWKHKKKQKFIISPLYSGFGDNFNGLWSRSGQVGTQKCFFWGFKWVCHLQQTFRFATTLAMWECYDYHGK